MVFSQVHVNGLILAGGKSTRMGEDKAWLQWHGKEQIYYLADMLHQFCNDVFISCGAEQVDSIDNKYKILIDEVENAGPLAAIISAFHQNKNCAWLVVACDLPLVDGKTLDYLIQQRDGTADATAFESPYDNLPEPLITIWEPAALSLLERAFSQRNYSPQRVLMNSRINRIKAPDADALLNANTPADKEKILKLLGKKAN